MDEKLAERMGMVAREARQRARLTQADVAERLNIASEVYGRLERGKMLPSVTTLRKLSRTLGVSADELLALCQPDPSASPPPEHEESPEFRRLLRRIARLDRRKVRLLNLLAAALGK